MTKSEVRENPQELVNLLSHYVNVMSCDQKSFAEAVMREHRTIQQNVFGLFLRTIEEWSKQDHYDLRNEYTVETSKDIMKLLGGCSQTPFI